MSDSNKDSVYVFYLKGAPKENSPTKTASKDHSHNIQAVSEDLLAKRNSIAFGIKCRCEKSSCIRLKCSCFSGQGYCNPSCECKNCLNTENHQAIRRSAIEMNKNIFNNAFKKIDIITVNGVKITNRGCNCKLSWCNSMYCQCNKNEATCSSLCSCQNCSHDKVVVKEKETVNKNDKNRRKRLKIVIKDTDNTRESADFDSSKFVTTERVWIQLLKR
jgi:hypothetical protein